MIATDLTDAVIDDATPEAGVADSYKQLVLSSGVADTTCIGKGLGMIRAIRNGFTERMSELEATGIDLDTRRSFFDASTLKMAAFDGDVEDGKVEAGQSTGLTDRIMPAAKVVAEIAKEYTVALNCLPKAISL